MRSSDMTPAQVAAEMATPDWQPIETAPKDGSLILLTWMENGKPQEVWPMQWGHIQRNGLFPGKVGMWVAPDQSVTWNDDGDGAPTHWASLRQEEREGSNE